MSATITVANLRIALRATVVATDRTGNPVLECVHLQVAGGRLLATATDRYALSHARREAEGELDPVLVHRLDIAMTLSMLVGYEDSNTVTIGRVGNRPSSPLYVRVERRRLVLGCGTPVEAWPGPSVKRIGKLVADRNTCSLDGVMAVDPWHIERLLATVRPLAERDRANISDAPAGATLRVYANGPEKPLRLEIGDWWVGVIMPISHSHTAYGDIPNVPFGGEAA